MNRRVDATKAAQATAVLLRGAPGASDNYMRVLKLLYLANRAAFAEVRRPIFVDRHVAMQRGPLPSGVYDLMKGAHLDIAAWAPYFVTEGYRVRMVRDPGMGRLSRYEIGKLQEVADRYRDMDEWALVEETHKLPEWQRNDPGTSSKEIPLADLLEAVGLRDELAEIEADLDRDERLRQIFGQSA